ncbi:hypothetical protein [Deinococcus hohokamensis]|uniref:Uncharacterized protein n=1 Tax=Deinococcus hohokamensis TaxID=309883 RepID=A0ABV9ID40_9DEIO
MDNLITLLKRATKEERMNLGTILKVPDGDPKALTDALAWHSQHKIQYYFRDRTYTEIVQQVARRLKMTYTLQEDVQHLERRILQRVLSDVWAKLAPEERTRIEEALREEFRATGNEGKFVGVAGLIAGIAAGKASGFGVYMLSSVVLSSMASTLGITLPFAAYMGASRAISVMLGPVGLVITALSIGWALGSPNHNKVLLAVIHIAMIRARLDSPNLPSNLTDA